MFYADDVERAGWGRQFTVADDDDERWTWVPNGRRLDFDALPPPAPREPGPVVHRYSLGFVAPDLAADPAAAARFVADWKAFDASWDGPPPPPKTGPNFTVSGRQARPGAPSPRRRRWWQAR